ncbi:MAG: type IX secretion system sortase PorU [Bacteroidia bacterium]|nr:type IX secretion system sortase PorU [Bacteroidia bacterium]
MQLLKNLRNFDIKSLIIIMIFYAYGLKTTAQTSSTTLSIRWNEAKSAKNLFQDIVFLPQNPNTPVLQGTYPIGQGLVSNLTLVPVEEGTFSSNVGLKDAKIETQYQISYTIGIERGNSVLLYQIVPLRKDAGGLKKLEKYKLSYTLNPSNAFGSNRKKQIYAANSVLASGEWIKIGTTQNGVYRIDYGTLRNIGINPDLIDPRNLKLYGRGAGAVPQNNDAPRIDDLKEIAINVLGENDGKFNPGDFILFYGESQANQWNYDVNTKKFSFVSNYYCDTTYYFLTANGTAGKRIQKSSSVTGENATVNKYTYLTFYNNERVNLVKSGKVWLGEEFDRITQQGFNVSIPNLIPSEPIYLRSSVTSRSFVASEFKISLNNIDILTQPMGTVSPGFENPYTSGLSIAETSFLNANSNFTLTYSYNKPSSGSIGWLDFFEIQAKAELKNVGGNFIFKDASNTGSGKITKYQIGTNRILTVMDVTDPLTPQIIEGSLANNLYTITYPTDSLKTFAVIDGSNYLQVTGFGKIANQNLHSLSIPDGFIISHPLFISEAKKLAEFHKNHDNLTIHVVNIQEIYNEFSSGAQDISAIRDFLRMFYERASSPSAAPKYCAFFGRASYDYKYRQNPNTNFIPTFESWESFNPTASYCSDDFFGFLDPNEGKWDIGSNPNELLDIGIGRIPVTTESEAALMVNKFKTYYSTEAFGPWRNKLVFVADDEDGNLHQEQADNLANGIITTYPEFNVDKIYLDAYKKESTAGGARFPEAQKAINNAIQNGVLIFNYTGHGGEVGLTAERVLGLDDINKWTNGLAAKGNKLPLFLTATCEFSRFDDPARYAAGEQVLLNPNGGGIGLFTTVRLVYSGQNEALNQQFYKNVGFDSISQLNPPRLGDVVRKTKNGYLDVNTRNFTLLGNPFMMLAYTQYNVKTTEINGTDYSLFQDTLKALKKFEIKGIVADNNGNRVSNFNGVIYPVVYDKFTNYVTLGNNPPESVPMNFYMQNNVLYRGKSSVTNGEFTFSFVVPKDIAYEFGKGKISYYSDNKVLDANGFTNDILIGGTADSAGIDQKGPEIKLYLNDEKFVNGGTTNENPKLIAKLFDENGINTTGRGIGRDLLFVIDNNQTQAVIVNDYYQATLNSYQSGEVSYDMSGLSAGKHQLTFRAYDVYNNISEANVEFEVKNSEKLSINNLLNYPNPFNNATTFHFDHNLNGQEMQVLIQIFTVNGKLAKTLSVNTLNDGTHFDKLFWDGKDDYGDKLANGVYIYKCKIQSPGHKMVEKTEKLVILN